MKHAKENILHSPRITEKASAQAALDCYVFNIHKDAAKRDVSDAVRAIYKVSPRMVRLATVAGKKKAYVYLKKGDKIELA